MAKLELFGGIGCLFSNAVPCENEYSIILVSSESILWIFKIPNILQAISKDALPECYFFGAPWLLWFI